MTVTQQQLDENPLLVEMGFNVGDIIVGAQPNGDPVLPPNGNPPPVLP
jgi:hypothetical protein